MRVVSPALARRKSLVAPHLRIKGVNVGQIAVPISVQNTVPLPNPDDSKVQIPSWNDPNVQRATRSARGVNLAPNSGVGKRRQDSEGEDVEYVTRPSGSLGRTYQSHDERVSKPRQVSGTRAARPAGRLAAEHKGIQTGVDRLGRNICWDNVTGHRVDCPLKEESGDARPKQPAPEPGEKQPVPGEDNQQQQAQDQQQAFQALQAQQTADRSHLSELVTNVLDCGSFISETTAHLLSLLAEADPMEREWFLSKLALDEGGQWVATRLVEQILPGTREGVIQTSPQRMKRRGQSLDPGYFREKVLKMQECGAFVGETVQKIMKEAGGLDGFGLDALLQNIGLDERKMQLANILALGALGVEELGQGGQKGIGSNPGGPDHRPHEADVDTGEVYYPDEYQEEHLGSTNSYPPTIPVLRQRQGHPSVYTRVSANPFDTEDEAQRIHPPPYPENQTGSTRISGKRT